MTLPEFCLIQDAFIKKYQLEQRLKWEIARYQAYITVRPHYAKGALTEPKQLGTFSWEEPTKAPIEVLQNKDLFKIFPDTI